ncbi:GTP cyclohydrolase N terminal-domain-containing protein [Cyathus striatus]|nr:GTP cyclohydrolase N terminal-domain-containing protein [Cyathus striatus]
MPVSDAVLTQILAQLEAMQVSQQAMQAKLDELALTKTGETPLEPRPIPPHALSGSADSVSPPVGVSPTSLSPPAPSVLASQGNPLTDKEREKLLYPGRVNLTTYPDQHGSTRGPVICSRLPSTIKHRNAIGAHSGSYSIYRALSIAMGALNPSHKPDYSKTEPPVNIPPQPSWLDPKKIEQVDNGLDIRPSIAVTKAHLKMSELDESVRRGVCHPLRNEDGSVNEADPGVEVGVSKAAVEPVWYLPGVAERFGISESLLRGMYPELITLGNPEFMYDPSKILTLRVHDECGVGVVVYFRKEGRALGEVTKYLVYNLRKRGGDSADKYFKSTELIAGVKDMRFQALMPDVLHWLGITKVDNMISMSDMKYDAIVKSGIPILKRYDIPDHLIPPDSRVEIDAKIAAGYFSSTKKLTEADLVKTVGRTWEETEH